MSDPFITSVATFRAVPSRHEGAEKLCVHGADSEPGDQQTPSALGTVWREVLVHRKMWRNGSQQMGCAIAHQDQAPVDVRDDDRDKGRTFPPQRKIRPMRWPVRVVKHVK